MIAPIRAARPRSGARTLEHLEAWEDDMLAKHGWYVHAVYGQGSHTHGLLDKFGHVDLEILFPLTPDAAHAVLASAVEKIKGGTTFGHGQVVVGILNEGFRVKFVGSREGGRPVLRILIPDPQNRLPGEDGCDPFYAAQIEGNNAPQGDGGQDG